MPISYKDNLKSALELLDHADDNHWTDSGLPRMDVLKTLAGDEAITRKDVEEAFPGFERKTEVSNDALKEIYATGDEPDAPAAEVRDPDALDGDTMSAEEVKLFYARKVSDAEAAYTQARTDVADAQSRMARAAVRMQKANAEYSKKYPPVSWEQNIKDHLNATAKHNEGRALSALDQKLASRRRIDAHRVKTHARPNAAAALR